MMSERAREACSRIILRRLGGGSATPAELLAECRRIGHPHSDAGAALEQLVQEGAVGACRPLREAGVVVPLLARTARGHIAHSATSDRVDNARRRFP